MNARPAPWGSPLPARFRLLVVDDDPDTLESFQAILANALPEITVWTANSAEEALDLLRRESVDAILSDLKMPGMDGLSLLRHAQAMKPGTAGAIITAFPKLETAIQAQYDVAVYRFLTKPVSPEDLVGAVDDLRRRCMVLPPLPP